MSLSQSAWFMVHVVLDMSLHPAWLIKSVQSIIQSSLNQRLSLGAVAILSMPDLTTVGLLWTEEVIFMIIGISFPTILILQQSMVSLHFHPSFFSLGLIHVFSSRLPHQCGDLCFCQ